MILILYGVLMALYNQRVFVAPQLSLYKSGII